MDTQFLTRSEKNRLYRKTLKDRKRIVVKVGSSSLLHPETGRMDYHKIDILTRELSDLKNQGKEVILVSSGATAVGREALLSGSNFREIQEDSPITIKQACASVGQARLMMIYERLFAEYNHITAQILMTMHTMTESSSRRNAQNTFSKLLELGVIPVVNENDTVAIDELELEMGENDSLAANVAVISGAELLIIMSDIDGLFDKDPRKNDDAQLIPVVQEITDDIVASAGGAGTAFGSGGMATKIKAAKIANDAGIDLVIINGRHPDNLYGVFENKPVGTVFQAAATLA